MGWGFGQNHLVLAVAAHRQTGATTSAAELTRERGTGEWGNRKENTYLLLPQRATVSLPYCGGAVLAKRQTREQLT